MPLALIALSLSLPGAVTAATGDPKAPLVKSLKRELRKGFQPVTDREIRDAIVPVDINSDGIDDWQINFSPLGSAWCGTGGCRYQLWLGSAKGLPRLVFDRQMREVTIVKRQGRTVFVFDFHGSQCGGFGAEACPGEFAWDKRSGTFALQPTPGKHTGLAKPIVRIW
ncbi:MAG: hypothetical protein J0M19_09840 [Sphingomonadales bacterium]|nr:hypothetical protein [Sphingomonadales bacterium]